MRLNAPVILAVVGIGAVLFFGIKMLSPHGAPPGGPGGPVPVDVQTLHDVPTRVWSKFSGRTRAVDYAEIRPEVSGRITEIHFEDGQRVNKGDVLFLIDPRPFEATLAKARADLATAQANAGFAATDFSRAQKMVKAEAIAKRVYDQRASDTKVAAAAVKAAQAQIAQAQLDVEHAHVIAPISGRASRAEITVGNLVQAGPNAPLLTSIVSNDGIYADFEVDEQTYLNAIHSGANTREEETRIPVELYLNEDANHVYKGTISTFDNHIDTTSGTIRARAKFANEDGGLVPGMFVSVRMAGSSDAHAVVVPDVAIGTDQDKKFVYLVTADNKAKYQEVELGATVEGGRIALNGVKEGDKVVVGGLQHIKPDAPVAPKEIEPGTLPVNAPGAANSDPVKGAGANGAAGADGSAPAVTPGAATTGTDQPAAAKPTVSPGTAPADAAAPPAAAAAPKADAPPPPAAATPAAPTPDAAKPDAAFVPAPADDKSKADQPAKP